MSSCCCHLVIYLKHRGLQCFFNGDNSINREIVSSTHPFTYLSLALTKHERKVFLPQVALHKDFVDAVNNLK